MIPIAQLLTAPTSDQFRATAVTTLQSLGVPAGNWRKGGALSTLLTVMCMSLATMAGLLSTIINGFFLPTATGNGLVLLAYYVYGVTAPAATFANGQVTFTNTGSGVFQGGNFAAGKVYVTNPTTGITYFTTQDLNLTASGGANPVQTVSVQATTAGSVGSSIPGAINTLVTTMLGVTVTNALAVIGSDALPDPALRLLCTASLGARSTRGPRSAYKYAISIATNAVTGNIVNINRSWVSPSSHFGQVPVYIASPSGVVDPNDLTGVVNSIELNARPQAVTDTVAAAAAVNYAPTLTVWCTAPPGVTTGQLSPAIATAIASYLSTYPIGGATANDDANPAGFTGLFADGIKSVCGTGAATLGASVISVQGATDLALATGQVATNGVVVNTRLVQTGAQ